MRNETTIGVVDLRRELLSRKISLMYIEERLSDSLMGRDKSIVKAYIKAYLVGKEGVVVVNIDNKHNLTQSIILRSHNFDKTFSYHFETIPNSQELYESLRIILNVLNLNK